METKTTKTNESATNVVNNITISDIYATKYTNNIVVQTNGTFVGYDANGTEANDKGNFVIAPLRLLKEASKDRNASLMYSLVNKNMPMDILLSLIKLVLLNSTISIKRTFVPKGTNEGQENDRWHTEIIKCSNTCDIVSILPIVQMQLANAQKASQVITNTFNI